MLVAQPTGQGRFVLQPFEEGAPELAGLPRLPGGELPDLTTLFLTRASKEMTPTDFAQITKTGGGDIIRRLTEFFGPSVGIPYRKGGFKLPRIIGKSIMQPPKDIIPTGPSVSPQTQKAQFVQEGLVQAGAAYGPNVPNRSLEDVDKWEAIQDASKAGKAYEELKAQEKYWRR
jgi:hypothetical protein